MSKGRIAVIIPSVYDQLDKEFLTGVYTAAKSIDYDTLVFTAADEASGGETNIYNLPFCGDIDGIIFAANRFSNEELKSDICKRLEKSKIPCVATEDEHKGVTGIFINQQKPIFDITQHLITCHELTDIICLTGPKSSREAEERAAGFVQAMSDNGIDTADRVIYGDFWHDTAINLAKAIADGEARRPEAIVCTSDIMAVKLCQELPKYGIKVPQDIAVTGYDGSLYSLVTTPPITTVCGCDLSLGGLAVKTLAEKLNIFNEIPCINPYIRYCRSCGCTDDSVAQKALLKETERLIMGKLQRKPLMFSNHIAKMSDCSSIAQFAAVLDSLRYILSGCADVSVCLCEDWRADFSERRTQGFSDNISLIYSDNHHGEIAFPLEKLLLQLNLPHQPQFWVFSSLHYFDKIMGYAATRYDEPQHFTMDEFYIGWCDAVANGLDIVIKRSNTEYIRQKLTEKNARDIYTGLLSRAGFIERLKCGDEILMLSFPSDYKEMQYFIPIVSAVLRSENSDITAVYLGEAVFCTLLSDKNSDDYIRQICGSVSELGIYITADKINTVCDVITDTCTADEQLKELYNTLTDKALPRSSEIYSEVFTSLRKEIRYSPHSGWNITVAAERTRLSASHFQKLYKQYFGISFNEELIQFRNERAKYLLKNTSLSIKQISEECGYSNPAHFMRQFKQREGISAGHYRKEM